MYLYLLNQDDFISAHSVQLHLLNYVMLVYVKITCTYTDFGQMFGLVNRNQLIIKLNSSIPKTQYTKMFHQWFQLLTNS